jgi:predicted outer membrane repeat protein
MSPHKLPVVISLGLALGLSAPAADGQSVIYVDDNASGADDGSSWCDAYPDLQDALAAAGPGTTIRVAGGTYTPDQGTSVAPDDRTTTFRLANGVTLEGGYAGCGAPDPDARDILTYESVLSGDRNGDDGAGLENNAENSLHVVTGSGTDASAILDGFTITGGNANGYYCWGAGMLNETGSPTVTDCTFSENHADGCGGGMYNDDASPTVTDCRFIHNSAEYGGGMCNRIGSAPVLTDCTFDGNTAASYEYGGGGIYSSASSPALSGCSFTNNTSRNGAAIWSGFDSAVTATGCTFNENIAAGSGGGIYGTETSVTLDGCLLHRNVAADPFVSGMPRLQIGDALPREYELSGAAWHARLGRLILVDDGGRVISLETDGAIQSIQDLPGTLEAVCVANADTDLVYVGIEHPDSIVEFDFLTGQVTRTFDLTAVLTGPDDAGLTALTFVPDSDHPEGGLFYVGLQADGAIYVIELPIASSATETTVTHISTIPPAAGLTDLSGMDYERDEGVLYIIFDSENVLRATDASGSLIQQWFLPGNDQEGIALVGGELFVAQDVGAGGPWPSCAASPPSIQGLHFDRVNEVLWGLVGQKTLRAMEPDGTLLSEWQVPEGSGTQEGITFANDSCEFFVAWDDSEGGSTNRLRKYGFAGCTSECADQRALWTCDLYSPSPFVLPSVSIGGNLPPAGSGGYETSGAVWHPGLNRLFTVHDGNSSLPGSVTRLALDGTDVHNWAIGGDFEGVTVADPNTNFVYIAKEQPYDSVIEFDYVTGNVTKTWDLTDPAKCTAGCEVDGAPFPDPPDNRGIESITFVPDDGPSGGVFYLGLETDGRVYKVRLDLNSGDGEYEYLGHACRLGPWNSRKLWKYAFAGAMGDATGGGCAVVAGPLSVSGCRFHGNRAARGAGLFHNAGDVTIVNTLFSGNAAETMGGAFYGAADSVVATNCTLSGNEAETTGGLHSAGGSVTIANAVLWGNAADGSADEAAQVGGTAPAVNFSCIQGLTGSMGGIGNIGGDPAFADSDGADDLVGTPDDDLHLSGGSPCIDAGENAALPLDVLADLDGNPRRVDDPSTCDTGSGSPPVVDIGAYEFPGSPGCCTDSDCDDGAFCTGEETCQDATCIAGIAPCTSVCEQCDEGADVCLWCVLDLDRNGWIGSGDFGRFAGCYGQCYPPGDPCLETNFDVSPDGCVGSGDFGGFAGCYGSPCSGCNSCFGPP